MRRIVALAIVCALMALAVAPTIAGAGFGEKQYKLQDPYSNICPCE